MQSGSRDSASEMIGVQDVLTILRIRKILILSWMIAGVFGASAYLILTPKLYESTTIVRMAQYYTSDGTYQYIEDPSAAAVRLAMPAVHTAGIRQACGLSENEELNKNLNGILNAVPNSSIAGGLELRVRGRGQEQSRDCTEAIVEELLNHQKSMIEYRLKGHQQLISSYEQEMRITKKQLDKLNSKYAGIAYLSNANRLNWLEARIDNLKNENLLSQTFPTNLITPIFTTKKQVAPKPLLSLVFGLLVSFMLGLMHALIKELQARKPINMPNSGSVL